MTRGGLVFLSGLLWTLASENDAAAAGKIIVAHDEWTLSNGVFGAATSDAAKFTVNVASFFMDGSHGDFLVYENDYLYGYKTDQGAFNTSFVSTMTAAGHTVTRESATATTLTLARLRTFDGVFVCGRNLDQTALIQYVLEGGNVYLAGGTGTVNEATAYNTFLNYFGLQFSSTYNTLNESYRFYQYHPAMGGWIKLYHRDGSSISDIQPAEPQQYVLATRSGHGIYAVYDCDEGLDGMGSGTGACPGEGSGSGTGSGDGSGSSYDY
jgi:hypothetical protein